MSAETTEGSAADSKRKPAPAELILEAFRMARASGKSDWRSMTIAVLKNRLLQLTGREFNEKNYGVTSLKEFVLSAPDVARLDDSTLPPLVELVADIDISPASPGTGRLRPQRLRDDLWNAVVDYRSGIRYVWDVQDQRAEPASGNDDPRPSLPTISDTILEAWREEFVAKHSDRLGESAKTLLANWRRQRGQTRALPRDLQSKWNNELTQRVIARLREWLSVQGLAEPNDLLLHFPLPRRTAVDLNTLRAVIIDCINVMTAEELKELRLPASAVVRARGVSDTHE